MISPLEEILADVPVDDPVSTIEYDGDDVVITIEGRAKPWLPTSAITALVILGAAAFVCPGIFVAAAVLVPIGLLALAGIYVFAPHLLQRPVDTQTLFISPDHLRLVESCPSTFAGKDSDGSDLTETIVFRDDIASTTLIVPTEGEDSTPGIQIESTDGDSILLGSPLVEDSTESPRLTEDHQRELKWLLSIVDTLITDTTESKS